MIWIKKYMATKPHQEYIYTYFCENDIERSNQYYMNSKFVVWLWSYENKNKWKSNCLDVWKITK
jgi:hypothetical protein